MEHAKVLIDSTIIIDHLRKKDKSKPQLLPKLITIPINLRKKALNELEKEKF